MSNHVKEKNSFSCSINLNKCSCNVYFVCCGESEFVWIFLFCLFCLRFFSSAGDKQEHDCEKNKHFVFHHWQNKQCSFIVCERMCFSLLFQLNSSKDIYS